MTIKIDMNPRLQPAGAVNGFVRDNNDLAQKNQVPKTIESNKQGPNSEKVKVVSEELDNQLKTDEKLDSEKSIQEQRSDLSKNQLDSVVTSLNTSIQSVQRDLEFSVDDKSGQVVINVKDKETDKVVRQIPSEEALKLAENLQKIVDSRNDKDSGSAEGIFVSTSA